ncbi:hypothetical protein N1031_06925 [Herbiconiux moechotypicola]|uniref:HK97 gp10 family phage protein n=1 Tax=Herbiconiux moechotypicola TaxID=637393 RepID=A0ABP5QCD2_9MICO|nr:hypothetical protein [Herbiconiux moechotypicola]MCS5729489.1 hypothetical protein [Herbiconiux moechotypicola]
MAKKVRIDSAGAREILKWASLGSLTVDVAQKIADSAEHTTSRGVEMPIEVYERDVTDRVGANVVIAHPAGMAVEAKYGILARAATDAGIEMKARAY